MNLKKGFLKLTLALSILSGIILTIVLLVNPPYEIGNYIQFVFFFFIIGFIAIWLFYFFIKWIVIGFIVKGFKD
jgi:hypothetical protein